MVESNPIIEGLIIKEHVGEKPSVAQSAQRVACFSHLSYCNARLDVGYMT
jgi:hypothetical protein